MKSQFITLCFLFFFLLVSNSFTAPDSLWTKTFGGVYDKNGFSVQQTSYGDNVLYERIISKSVSKGTVRHLSESNIFNDRKSSAAVNKLILNTGFLLIEALTYNWDNTNWVIVSKYKNTYDENNNLIEGLDQDWDGENWLNEYMSTYTYNAKNNLIVEVGKDWDGAIWVNEYKSIYTYNEFSNMIEELCQSWDGANWVIDWQLIYSYDVNNNLIEEMRHDWDGVNWVIEYKWTYTYDVNNNLIEELYQFWVGENWVIGGKYTLTYDENNNWIEWLYEYWDDQNWVNYMMRTFSYMTITGIEPLLDEVNTYNISNNYPNPFNPSTTIEFNLPKATNVRIEIFNIAGQKISTPLDKKIPAGKHEVEFNAENLSSGIYYYRIEAGEFQDVKKMILLR